MDPAAYAHMQEHAAARYDAQPDTWCLIRVPTDDTRLDGAVVELQLHDDGVFTGEVRIPGPPQP